MRILSSTKLNLFFLAILPLLIFLSFAQVVPRNEPFFSRAASKLDVPLIFQSKPFFRRKPKNYLKGKKRNMKSSFFSYFFPPLLSSSSSPRAFLRYQVNLVYKSKWNLWLLSSRFHSFWKKKKNSNLVQAGAIY